MLGNWKGWTLAALIVVMEGALVVAALRLDDLSSPTAFGRRAELYQRLELPVSPDTVVRMDAPGDASALYREALEDYLQRPLEYAQLDDREHPDLGPYKAFALLARACGMRAGAVLLPWSDDVLRFGANDRGPLLRLAEFGKLALRAALNLEKDNRPGEAKALYESIFALGAKLWDERLVYGEATLGIELMSAAGAGLRGVSKEDPQAVARIDAFLDAQRKFTLDPMQATWKVLADASNDALRDHAGDAFAMASDRMQERMWRVEAIFKLGYLRYDVGAGRRGDQVGATRVTTRIAATDPDPIVKRAAKVASELTEAEWRRR